MRHSSYDAMMSMDALFLQTLVAWSEVLSHQCLDLFNTKGLKFGLLTIAIQKTLNLQKCCLKIVRSFHFYAL